MRMTTLEESSSSAEVIAYNEDLLTELLLLLPVKSLLRFRSVSKRWLSLITHPRFTRRKHPKFNAVSALFSRSSELPSSHYAFVSLDPLPATAPLTVFHFVDLCRPVMIWHSCGGLLLCCKPLFESARKLYIYNLTTGQSRALPRVPSLSDMELFHFSLAFDPSKSKFYKVVCIATSNQFGDRCRILIYSSKTGHWRFSGAPFIAPGLCYFPEGVYCNGAMHWAYECGSTPFYFDLDQELVREMPTPPDDFKGNEYNISYFGESGGHLHLVGDCYQRLAEFNVYEMESDYSGWFVKYRVDLKGMTWSGLEEYHPSYYQFYLGIMCLVRGDKEDDSFIVLYGPGRVIRYNFMTQTHQVIYETNSDSKVIRFDIRKQTQEDMVSCTNSKCLLCRWPVVHQYIVSYASV